MKVLLQVGYGIINNNLQFKNIKKPEISGDEVLIKVNHSRINPHDYKVVLGEFKKIDKMNLPAPVGNDFSGIIVKAGLNAEEFREGDYVFGIAKGTIGEYCIVKPEEIEIKLKNISFSEVAVTPVVGMTTIQAFKKIGGINKGDKILIHAASGCVGSFAIQYAKSKGAFVYTTTVTSNINWVKELGADVVIDYKKDDYLNVLSDLDIVFNTLGAKYTFDAFEVIKKCGKIVSLLPAEMNKQIATELKIPKLVAFFLSLKPSKIKKLEN